MERCAVRRAGSARSRPRCHVPPPSDDGLDGASPDRAVGGAARGRRLRVRRALQAVGGGARRSRGRSARRRAASGRSRARAAGLRGLPVVRRSARQRRSTAFTRRIVQHDLAELAAGGEALVGGGRRRRGGMSRRSGTRRAALEAAAGRGARRARAAAAFSSSGRARRVEARIRPRLPISASRFSSALAPAPTPITTIRPRVASALTSAGRLGAPTSSRTTSNGPCSSKPSGVDDRVRAQRRDGVAQVGVAHGGGHVAPAARPSCTRRGADAARGAVDEQPLARLQPALGEQRVVGGREHLRERRRPAASPAHRARASAGARGRPQLGLPAAADDAHDAVALGEARGARRQRSATSPASSRPGMSCGQPGGAG